MPANALDRPGMILPLDRNDLLALPPVSQIALRLALTLAQWERRARTRQALARLEGAHLDDLGLTTRSAAAEAAKPFWRA